MTTQDSIKRACHTLHSRMACFSEQTLGRELILKLVGEKKGNDTAVDPNAPEGGSSYQPKATPWGRELGVNQRPTGAKALGTAPASCSAFA